MLVLKKKAISHIGLRCLFMLLLLIKLTDRSLKLSATYCLKLIPTGRHLIFPNIHVEDTSEEVLLLLSASEREIPHQR